MALSRYGGVTGTVHVNEDFENINVALNNVAAENDTIKSNVNKAQSDIDNHKLSTLAHEAQNIAYEGEVSGAKNVKQGLDITKQRIDTLILESGNSSPEVVDARSSYPVLGGRLNAFDAQLADYALHKNNKVTDIGGVHGLSIETGTWLPILRDINNNPLSHTMQYGKYEKLNKKVVASFFIDINGLNAASGQVVLNGLPFIEDRGYVYSENLHFISTDANLEMVEGMVTSSYLTLRIKRVDGSVSPMTTANMPTNISISGTIIYFTN
ncbi:hypothetical protein RE628_11540 [Paenibacillus sp. D2_2]|uniref:hypothetical protein n=1 Tax=Paenibacillus sp. D2_2 TaxID=3073092 RepID=UPI002814C289|nr:hypothetical protein [Paenibacillus sp. D2_2]WMT42858.1 hypothetical protein RE628_11540 [Paenibacillus sp. D2_2]